ncbi:hypothetical protein A2U01_0039436, partial [Trifolium medium]|nr:hypothetical protein [Trifolium medium]
FICKSVLNIKEASTMSSHQVISENLGPIWENNLKTHLTRGTFLRKVIQSGQSIPISHHGKQCQNPGAPEEPAGSAKTFQESVNLGYTFKTSFNQGPTSQRWGAPVSVCWPKS